MDTNITPTSREIFLAEMECTVPWHKLRMLVIPVYSATARPGMPYVLPSRRLRPLELDRMLRIFFLQRWFRLNDTMVREAICDSSAMRSFICLSAEAVPHEHEIRRFRELLVAQGIEDMVVLAAERHLRKLGIAIEPGAIVDAALIKAPVAHAQAPYARIIDTAGQAAG